MKLDAHEQNVLESVERGECRSSRSLKSQSKRFARYARATFRKDRRLNIRTSSKDLEAALEHNEAEK